MNSNNYKIIEERFLSQMEVSKGMDFEQVLKIKPSPNFPFKNWIVGGAIAVGVVTGTYFLVNNKSEQKNSPALAKDSVIQTIEQRSEPEQIEENKIVKKAKVVKNTDSIFTVKTISTESAEENEDNYGKEYAGAIKKVDFKNRFNTDAETAITIKDSIYGPTNVSLGKGDYREYKHETIEKGIEQNSAWFRFEIKKDTLLTFHIVPTTKTDDYDFALFKCDNYNCMRDLKLGKLKPVTFCFSWNTSENPNTGLSRRKIDTTFQMEDRMGNRHGRSYAGAIRVKAGETYYLMVNNSLSLSREPDGFMIYFYNYLPKSRANTYFKTDPYHR